MIKRSDYLRKIADALDMRMDMLYDELVGFDIIAFSERKNLPKNSRTTRTAPNELSVFYNRSFATVFHCLYSKCW